MGLLRFCAIAVFLLAASAAADNNWLCVETKQQTVRIHTAPELAVTNTVSCAAYGLYNRTGNLTGWNTLQITTNGSLADDVQAYAAGFLEGYASAEDIVNFHYNTLGENGLFASTNDKVKQFISDNDEWVRAKAGANAANCTKWATIALSLKQIDGMLDGIARAGFNMTRLEFLVSLAMPDVVSDLELVYPNAPYPKKKQQRRHPLTRLERLHCSSIVKVTPDFSDLFFAHTTWMNFNTMLRVFKTITLNYNSVPVNAKTIQFSSYPGQLSSTDDWYALDSGFGVMETSFSIFNMSLYDVLTPKSILSSLRAMLANRLATSGEHWAELFGFHNSGTYNNQWMVVDLNKFTPGQDLKPGTLWIVEQLPGIIDAKDQTTTLSYGYWPSNNVPSSRRLYDLAGYAANEKQDPQFNSFHNTVRDQLFRELQGNVTTVEDMKHLIQYNQYQTNPLEQGNPLFALASRGDLLPNGAAQGFGAIDAKIGAYSTFFKKHEVYAFSGPTPQQKIFSFNTPNISQLEPHVGLPTTFNFTWQVYQP